MFDNVRRCAALVLLLFPLAACGGHGLPAAGGGPASVGPAPQSAATATGLLSGLPSPAGLLAQERAAAGSYAPRSTSSVLAIAGDQLDTQIAPQHASASAGGTALFAPQWYDAQRTPGNLAYALYHINVGNDLTHRRLHAVWSSPGPWQFCYFAIPDFETNRWNLRPVDEDYRLLLSEDELAHATSGLTDNFFAVVMLMGSGGWELEKLELAPAPDYSITGVNLTEGWEGQRVLLYPELSPNTPWQPLSYAWTLGSGLTEPAQADNVIAVTLKTPGTYPCSVRITTPEQEAVFSFEFMVRPLIAPQLTGVRALDTLPEGMDSQVEYSDARLQATNEGGLPAGWYWYFGSAGSPSVSYETEPAVQWLAAGTYECYVVAFNSKGSDVCNFTVKLGPQPLPLVDDVQLSGPVYAGEQFALYPHNSGGAVASWSWDFGSAASPALSNSPSPIVTASAAGSFPCSVTATNLSGSSTYGFTLNVLPPRPPNITGLQLGGSMVKGVPRLIGVQNTGGPIETISWTFGPNFMPQGSTELTPTITAAQQGSYNCSVTATNSSSSSTYDFVLEVTDSGSGGGPA
jgi:PKD repeat protein